MKVILTKDVKGHGKKGEIITVKDGFGKNYLINNGLAILADSSGLKKLDTENKKKIELEAEQIKQAEKLKAELSKITLAFKVKTGKEDRVFGSVSSKQIVDELKKKNIDIDKKKIILDVPLSSIGAFNVKIELHKNIIGEIKVTLQKESR